jgi:uncharacterized membrane protein YbhN (UPF0104 family)
LSDSRDHDEAGSASPSRWLAAGARALVTLGILTGLYLLLPRESLVTAFRRLSFSVWIAAAFGFFLLHVIQAGKWRMLLGASGVLPSYLETLRAHFAGLFANLCLPSLIGGDVIRAGIIIQRRGKPESVAVGSLTDRLLDTTGLTMLAALGVFLAQGEGEGTALLAIGIAAVGCFAIWLVALAIALAPIQFDQVLPNFLQRIAGPLSRIREAIGNIISRPGTALTALLTTFFVQGGFVAINAELGHAMGIDLPFAVWLWAWSLAKIVALVPISLGGIGVREAALAAFLVPFGIEAGLAVAQSLVWESILIAVGATAGSLSLLMRAKTEPEVGVTS